MHDAMPVQEPLGQSGRAGGVHEQGGVLGAGGRVVDATCICSQALVESAFARPGLTHHQHVLERAEPRPGIAHAAPRLRVRDHDPRPRVRQAVLHRIRPVELREGHHHRPELVDREVGEGGLRTLPGVHGHRLAGPYPERSQSFREPVGESVEVGERVAAQGGVLVLEDEGGMVAARAVSVRAHGVECDVGAFRDPDSPCVARLVAVEVGAVGDRTED